MSLTRLDSNPSPTTCVKHMISLDFYFFIGKMVILLPHKVVVRVKSGI